MVEQWFDIIRREAAIEPGLKRLIDLLAAIVCLVGCAPLLLLIAILVRLDSPGPAIFKHRRIGKDGHPFDLYKFRSMRTGGDDTGYMNYLKELIESDHEKNGNGKPYSKMEDDPRVTRMGKFLRKYYLDELPQLWNVLRGEMSLVGPRPHVQLEVDSYSSEQRRRLDVRPGVTGLWQVEGKADCTFNELIAMDLDYVDHWSLKRDIQIVLKTLGVMSRGGEDFWTRKNKTTPGGK